MQPNVDANNCYLGAVLVSIAGTTTIANVDDVKKSKNPQWPMPKYYAVIKIIPSKHLRVVAMLVTCNGRFSR